MSYICNSINTPSQFRDEFHSYGRGDQFSYNAFGALFDYYTELAEGCGEPFEMDVIGICCDWCEYDTMQEAAEAYDIDKEIYKDDEWAILDWFQSSDKCYAIAVEGGGILVSG